MQNTQTSSLSAAAVFAWTEDRVARAIQLYLVEGFAASEVAEALGEVSRCAVIAKIRRLGYLKRETERAGAARARRPAASPRMQVERRLPPQKPPIPLPPLREAPATGRSAPLADLCEGACRWPIDDPGPGRMHVLMFCAGRADNGPYCATHRAIAYGREARP